MSKRVIHIGWGILSGVILFPFLFLIGLSVAKSWFFPHLLPDEWTLSHWISLGDTQGELPYSLGLSVGISVAVATISTLTAFFSSKYLAFSIHRRTWLMLAYFPFVLSPVIYAATITYYLIRMGLHGSVGGVMLGQLLIAYPYGVIVSMSFWTDRVRQMEQLVNTLGGNTMAAFSKVLFPMARGVIGIVFFQSFLISWFEYGLTRLIGLGKVPTLTLAVFDYITEANIYLAALSSVLLFLPPLLLLWWNKRVVLSRFT